MLHSQGDNAPLFACSRDVEEMRIRADASLSCILIYLEGDGVPGRGEMLGSRNQHSPHRRILGNAQLHLSSCTLSRFDRRLLTMEGNMVSIDRRDLQFTREINAII